MLIHKTKSLGIVKVALLIKSYFEIPLPKS